MAMMRIFGPASTGANADDDRQWVDAHAAIATDQRRLPVRVHNLRLRTGGEQSHPPIEILDFAERSALGPNAALLAFTSQRPYSPAGTALRQICPLPDRSGPIGDITERSIRSQTDQYPQIILG